jgi:glycosyltransferase involved in cell wall biosynthesis
MECLENNLMLDVGYASYFPPELNGCGDVTFNILGGIDPDRVRVTVYTTAKGPRPIGRGVVFRPIADLMKMDRHPHDLLVTTISNGRQAELFAAIVQKHGGVAHLHDGIVNHMLVGLWYSGRISRDEYYAIYERWYGRDVRTMLETWPAWWDQRPSRYVTGLGEVLDAAEAVIVNSPFLKERVARYFPEKPCAVVDQRYFDVPETSHIPEIPEVRTFGFVAANKGVLEAVDAIAILRKRGLDVRLHIIGKGPLPLFRALYERARDKDVLKLVKFSSDMSQPRFLRAIGDTFIGLQLRDPTFGETSSICQRMLFANVPMIVSNDGTYANLPPHVAKVPVPHYAGDIAEQIERLATSIGQAECRKQGREFIKANWRSQADYADFYFSEATALLATKAETGTRAIN